MWQQTLAPLATRVPRDHVVLVAVHVDDDDRATRAREILEGLASEVHVLDADVAYTPEEREASVGSPPPSTSAEDPGRMGTVAGKDEHGPTES